MLVTTNLAMRRLRTVSLILSLSAVSLAQYNGPDLTPQFVKALTHRLKPADLALPLPKLKDKLNEIGSQDDLFQVGTEVIQPDQPMPVIARVQRSTKEIMAVLVNEDDDTGYKRTFWIGLLNGRVSARAIPPNSDTMVGPIHGIWRRKGKYLVGVGFDSYYHQPKWQDAEFFVLVDSAKGPKMIQRNHVDAAEAPFGFANATSFTLNCAVDGLFRTIGDRTGSESATSSQIWEFRDGRYVLTRTVTGDGELEAVDRLMTAVDKKQQQILLEMMPNAAKRRVYLKLLREALRKEATTISEVPHVTLESREHPGYGVDIDVVKTNTGWLVRNVRIKHFKED